MIFIDSGAFIAWLYIKDQHHSAAVEGWQQLRNRNVPLFTTNLVLAESFDHLLYRSSAARATAAARQILSIRRLRIIDAIDHDVEAALKFIDKFNDQGFSFTDAVSFVVMKRLGLKHAFAFDRHFAIAGFERWPG